MECEKTRGGKDHTFLLSMKVSFSSVVVFFDMTSLGGGQSVRVKQEFPDTQTSCYYGGGPPPHGHFGSFSVKTEPGIFNGSCSARLPHTSLMASSAPWYPHNTVLPDQSFSTAVKSDAQLFNSATSADIYHCPEPYSYTPSFPATDQSTYPFSPWGLGSPATMGGATFGSLAGVDMTQSQEGASGSTLCPDGDIATRKRKPPRGPSRLKQELAEDDGWEPPLWRQQLQNIVQMREKRDAPVDLMGAHKNAEQTTHVSPEVNVSFSLSVICGCPAGTALSGIDIIDAVQPDEGPDHSTGHAGPQAPRPHH